MTECFLSPGLETPLVLSTGILVGFAIHHGVFIRGEWHIQAPAILVSHLSVFSCIAAARHHFQDSKLGAALDAAQLVVCGYVVGMYVSMLSYRVWFHPLSRAGFPGPWYARITKLWHVWACRGGQNHLVLDRLHRQYGDFVRTGPNEVAVFRPEVFAATDGPHTECVKSDWYDLLHPSMALVTTRDKAVHAARRKQWSKGFSPRALDLHVEKVLRHVDALDEVIASDAQAGRESEVRDLFFWFGFDAMSDFVFSRPFGMLRDRHWHHIIVRLQRALSLLGLLSPTPWLIHVGFRLAPAVGVLRDWLEMTGWCQQQMRDRVADEKRLDLRDLTHYLMLEDTSRTQDEDTRVHTRFWLQGDSLQVMVAGSGPTAVTLIGAFVELAKRPDVVEQLHQELDGLDARDEKAIARLPLLNAVLNETMRLYPALLTGGARATTRNGLTVAGIFLPPHTNLVAPQYCIARRADCFVRPDAFLPERWTTRPEWVLNASASTPWGTGLYSCLGKTLALDSMRLVVARMAARYRWEFGEGEKGECMSEGLKDQFVSYPSGLRLRFRMRE